MGYTIKIGETIEISDENGRRLTVVDARHDNAPASGDPTDNTNARWPSYSGWADFCRTYGLSDLFGELIPTHPGHCDLKPEHVEKFKKAAKKRLPANDYNRERMKWLLYWSEWALVNCKRPGIANS